MTDSAHILAINAGSSSVKFAVFGPDLEEHLHGELEGIGSHPILRARRRVALPIPESRDEPVQRRSGSMLDEQSGCGLHGHRVLSLR